MDIQKQGVIDQVKVSLESGRKLKDVLKVLGIKQSTYYRWRQNLSNITNEKPVLHPSDRQTTKSLTIEEVNLILKTKDDNPQMRHRQIQGLLQKQEIYISESSVFNILKAHNLVERYERRPAPWDEPFYEIYRANLMWGAD